jgi:hypothetical protein
MANSKTDYLEFSRLVSLILAIIPFTSWILGALTRFQEGKPIAALIRLVFGFNFVWAIDLICMVLNGRIWRFLDM